jgi:hypothetical protein
VDPRAGLDDVEKKKFLTLLGLELRPLGRPARSQPLYRLHYPGSSTNASNLLPFRNKQTHQSRLQDSALQEDKQVEGTGEQVAEENICT